MALNEAPEALSWAKKKPYSEEYKPNLPHLVDYQQEPI
jgi:hypothetical protein